MNCDGIKIVYIGKLRWGLRFDEIKNAIIHLSMAIRGYHQGLLSADDCKTFRGRVEEEKRLSEKSQTAGN